MKFLHVTIQTEKFDEEIKFYEEFCGLAIERDYREKGSDLVFLSNAAGETCVEIIRKAEAADAGNPDLSIGFKTDDVNAQYILMREKGFDAGPMIEVPGAKFFFVKDPAGVRVQFM